MSVGRRSAKGERAWRGSSPSTRTPGWLGASPVRQELPIAEVGFVVLLQLGFIDFDAETGLLDFSPFRTGGYGQWRFEDVVRHDGGSLLSPFDGIGNRKQ